MILYVASYPRSGNTWCRNILTQNFGLVTTSIYSGAREVIYYPLDEHITTTWANWEADNQPYIASLAVLSDTALVAELDQNSTFYNIWVKPVDAAKDAAYHQKTCIHKGCQHLLKHPVFRRYLSLKDELYIIKTHGLPEDRYFEGEKVIQLVRNPGPVFRSYQKYLAAHNKTISIMDLIFGRIKFGDWSRYHQAWFKAGETLADRYRLIQYEDMMADITAVLRRMEAFVESPIQQTEIQPFETYQKKDAEFYTFGNSQNWQAAFTRPELALLRLRHGKLMRKLGYWGK